MLKIEKLLLLLVVIMMINDDIDCKLIQVGKLKLSEIGIGTWAWGNRLLWGYNEDQDQELFKAYQYSVDNGINWFDTADSYGTGNLNGRSEELLGQFQLKISKSKQPYYLTKLAPYPWRIGENSMIEASKASIKRLNKNIDILQLHWPPSLQWQEREYLSAFSKVITDRKALQIGLSNYGPIGLERVVKILQNYNQKPYSNQVIYKLNDILIVIIVTTL
jgi:pyridoxine 4-dehydrogenase